MSSACVTRSPLKPQTEQALATVSPARAAWRPQIAALRALLRANARYWGSVAPGVRANLTRWRQSAAAIPDPRLRHAALAKLQDERFNVEVAATLATLAPRAHRGAAVKATVALQIAYDYLDLLTESSALAGEDGGADLLAALAGAMCAGCPPSAPEDGYLRALLPAVQISLMEMPSAARVLASAHKSAERCAQAQALNHASASAEGEHAFAAWAMRQAQLSPLGWRELAAGASASVLCMHALISAAARGTTHTEDALALEQLYLMIGALTMLDSLVDAEADQAAGTRSWLSRYRDEHEMAQALGDTAARAKAYALQAPESAHHLMTLGGVVAYYASARPAGLRRQDPLSLALRAELGATLAAPMLVMRIWRLAKEIQGAGTQTVDHRSLHGVSSVGRGVRLALRPAGSRPSGGQARR
jgi:tetraprenyl-beta-curcumene synthase